MWMSEGIIVTLEYLLTFVRNALMLDTCLTLEQGSRSVTWASRRLTGLNFGMGDDLSINVGGLLRQD